MADKVCGMSENDNQQGSFTEGNIPVNVFPLQDDVFISTNSSKGHILIHVRKYNKYGDKYYPSKEGVTLTAFQFANLISNNYLREKSTDKSKENPLFEFFQDLPPTIDPVFVHSNNRLSIRDQTKWYNIILLDFTDNGVVLTKEQSTRTGHTYNHFVTLNNLQWNNIFGLRDFLMNNICDLLHNKRADTLQSLFEKISGVKTEPSLDNNESGKYTELIFMLKAEMYKCLSGQDLLNPHLVDRLDLHHVNTLQNFNCAVINLNLMNVAKHFYDVVKQTDYMPYVNEYFF